MKTGREGSTPLQLIWFCDSAVFLVHPFPPPPLFFYFFGSLSSPFLTLNKVLLFCVKIGGGSEAILWYNERASGIFNVDERVSRTEISYVGILAGRHSNRNWDTG